MSQDLFYENRQLRCVIDDLRIEVKALQHRIDELEHRLTLSPVAQMLTKKLEQHIQAATPLPAEDSLSSSNVIIYRGSLMRFRFTTTPLKDVPLGTVVDGFTLTERSHTGKNAVGHRMHEGRSERVLLIYTEGEKITERTCTP